MGRGGGGNSYPELAQFARGNARNAWVDTGNYKAYLRQSQRKLPLGDYTRIRDLGNMKTLDLANVERRDAGDFGEAAIHDMPQGQRPTRGDFSGLMSALEKAAADNGYDAIYVEQIMNKFLPGVLDRMGYDPDLMHRQMNPDTPSMFKYLNRGIDRTGGGQM